ncbi:MAG TPA: STAS domain-containing protein [Gaiellales bacterium]|nr:STAS domain-containing protein [Gaiellales bacterium]
MSAAEGQGRSGLEVASEQTDRATSLICRGTLDARAVPRLRIAIDAALARPSVLVYLDLVDVTSADAAGARLVSATIRRCAAERVHLELWPGAAVERMLVALGVTPPRRAYPARPCTLPAGTGGTFPTQVSHRHPVWAIPAADAPASMGE